MHRSYSDNWSAGIANVTPPPIPRCVVTTPRRASVCTIFARYGAGMSAASAISLTSTDRPPAAATSPSAVAAYPTA